jgi:serine/threonine protein kinase
VTHAARWARVNELFHQALAVAPARREAFLDVACGSDRTLREEVATLLASHDRAGEFMERPAGRVTAPNLSPAPPARAGETIGHYTVKRLLGEGGMGVVYLAKDETLGREVALKAVAPRFTGDPARRERLRREARAAAALTHPNIATVYALEEIDGQVYIAGEFVPGATLREELRDGAMPAPRVLATGLALARALAAAHDRGIVHRDLKPENVIRTPAGEIKILDFGLARVRADSAAAPVTADHAAMGTPAYMSPEQIRGDAVDFRSDLFSLGVLLYELASGVAPFEGPDAASTLARILESEPAPLDVRVPSALASVPALPELARIVAMCLRKAPDARFSSTHLLVSALERAASGQTSAAPHAATPRAPSAPGTNAPFWWQFHQAVASGLYLLMLVPMWLAKSWMPAGSWLFLAALVSAIGASTMRLHVWFAFRELPGESLAQRRRVAGWIRLGDIAFVAALLVASGLTLSTHAEVSVLFLTAAVGALVAFAVIEPATARAAFESKS